MEIVKVYKFEALADERPDRWILGHRMATLERIGELLGREIKGTDIEVNASDVVDGFYPPAS